MAEIGGSLNETAFTGLSAIKRAAISTAITMISGFVIVFLIPA